MQTTHTKTNISNKHVSAQKNELDEFNCYNVQYLKSLKRSYILFQKIFSLRSTYNASQVFCIETVLMKFVITVFGP